MERCTLPSLPSPAKKKPDAYVQRKDGLLTKAAKIDIMCLYVDLAMIPKWPGGKAFFYCNAGVFISHRWFL